MDDARWNELAREAALNPHRLADVAIEYAAHGRHHEAAAARWMAANARQPLPVVVAAGANLNGRTHYAWLSKAELESQIIQWPGATAAMIPDPWYAALTPTVAPLPSGMVPAKQYLTAEQAFGDLARVMAGPAAPNPASFPVTPPAVAKAPPLGASGSGAGGITHAPVKPADVPPHPQAAKTPEPPIKPDPQKPAAGKGGK